ncbi:MAG: hypothetical protein P4L50_05715 [Anaerolineaceae bacterium]|nr:hypothetical protein [Anaerolineaceae bacterium]
MKNLRFLTLAVFVAAVLTAAPVQAARIDAGSSTQPLTFDLLCNGSSVCLIQNASLPSLNGNAIWFYQRPPNASGEVFSSLISLELPDGSSSGSAFYGPGGGSFSLGRNDEGSLDHFVAYGSLVRSVPGPILGSFLSHADGTYTSN